MNLKNNTPRIHHITPFWEEKFINFLGRGKTPPQTPLPSPPTAPWFSRLRRWTCDPPPPNVPVAFTPMLPAHHNHWPPTTHTAVFLNANFVVKPSCSKATGDLLSGTKLHHNSALCHVMTRDMVRVVRHNKKQRVCFFLPLHTAPLRNARERNYYVKNSPSITSAALCHFAFRHVKVPCSHIKAFFAFAVLLLCENYYYERVRASARNAQQLYCLPSRNAT